METGRESTTEESTILPSGERIIQLSIKRPLQDQNGRVVGIIGNTVDITYLKKIEEDLRTAKESAENASKAKTEFLYNVRHDIRTPFSGLLGLSTLLEAEEKNPQKKEYLHDIAQSAQELLNYFNEIVEYMELEDSTIPVLYKPFSLRKVFDEIVTMLRPAVKHQLINLESRIDKKIPAEIIGDRYRVHRILLNLAGNAVKFTKEGKISLGADLVKKEDRRMILKIWVKDTGIGIPEDKYNVIFERFSRLTASYSGIYKGTGLGLWAVKRLIEELGGQILVESELGKGSLFTCLIPFESLLTE
jgi:two-component system aerobic respiration control sensor histidine kinase ArcB